MSNLFINNLWKSSRFFVTLEAWSHNMILKISFSNIFSFKDEQVLTFQPQPLKEFNSNLHKLNEYGSEDILKLLSLYGHNSHGKSNVLKTISFFTSFIKNSFTRQSDSIGLENFALNTSSINNPSKFEIIFTHKEIKYRYGFQLDKERIYEEWLYYAPYGTKENYLFDRVDQEFRISKLWNKESENKINILAVPFATPQVLLLSVLIAQNNLVATIVANTINAIIVIRDLNDTSLLSKAAKIFSQERYAIQIQELISKADLGFNSIFDKIENKLSESDRFSRGFLQDIFFEKSIEKFELFTQHKIYDENKEERFVIEFDFLKNESDGSIKLFVLSCLLIYAIRNNIFLILDELDSKLHSDLVILIIKYFHSVQFSDSKCQFLFTTHNTILLDDILRRDQILFVEKNYYGESSIRPMHTKEHPVRSDISIEKVYRKGKLGGVSKKVRENPNQSELPF